jgi:hypothetical protein
VLAILLALVLGFAAAVGVLGDGGRPVNVIWALVGLLGVNFVALKLWLLGAFWSRRGGGVRGETSALAGRAWLRLVGALDRAAAKADLPGALTAVLGRARIAPWGLGAVSHGLWTAALLGAIVGMMLSFSTRRYGFVWETTILPAEFFVTLIAGMGRIPALLGFPVPDAETIAGSGRQVLTDEAARRAWAGWLVGCSLVYGVLPRVGFLLCCAGLWRRGVRRMRLDLSLPGYADLCERLVPASERLGVSDADLAVPRQAAPARRATGEGIRVAALELGDDLIWPPAWVDSLSSRGLVDAGRLDDRAARRAILERFDAHPPRRLLLAVDARQAPDRGHLHLLAELAERCGALRVLAITPNDADPRQGRLAQWREALAGLEWPADTLITDAAQARAWLEAA